MTIKKINLTGVKKEPNFIGSWNIDQSICNNLIDYFNSNHETHREGKTSYGINKDEKDSIDLTIYPKDLAKNDTPCINEYFENLFECYKSYQQCWPFLIDHFQKLDIGPFNIQKYNQGGHFAKIHSERTNLQHAYRLFAFMTYLNDDFEGGMTTFNHYDLEVKPVTGLTLIWPAEWTHAHQGQVITKGSKYIITGWLNIPLLPL